VLSFSSVSITSNYPLKKNGYLRFPKGGKTLARGGQCPPPPLN